MQDAVDQAAADFNLPPPNPSVKLFNRTLNGMIRVCIQEDPSKWDGMLSEKPCKKHYWVFTLRTGIQASTMGDLRFNLRELDRARAGEAKMAPSSDRLPGKARKSARHSPR